MYSLISFLTSIVYTASTLQSAPPPIPALQNHHRVHLAVGEGGGGGGVNTNSSRLLLWQQNANRLSLRESEAGGLAPNLKFRDEEQNLDNRKRILTELQDSPRPLNIS